MYEDWYTQQYHQYDDSFHAQWEIFGFRALSTSEVLGELRKLSVDDVFDWLGSCSSSRTLNSNQMQEAPPAELHLIFTRHKQHQTREIKPCYLAFDEEVFKKMLKIMHLSSAYPYMRVNAGASGNFAKYSTFDENCSVSHLSFVIRVPHSPRVDAKAVWSLAVSWDARTRSTTGLIESLSDEDQREMEGYLKGRAKQRQHPLFLPTMLLDLLIVFYVDHRRRFEHLLFLEESRVGITRGGKKTDAWNWDYERQRDATKRFQKLVTSLVYLERQLDFASSLADFILLCIVHCREENVFPLAQRTFFERISKELKESVLNDQNFATCQRHQVLCLQKRAQALVSVMYSVVAQNDSRMNVGIAKAAKLDSSSMATIAVLGIVFLPAMLVASMFSMSMFNFSTPGSSESPSSRRVRVSSDFWIFWAITVPLTLTVLVTWKVCMRRTQGSVRTDDSSLEEMIGCETGQTYPSPFYPETEDFFSMGSSSLSRGAEDKAEDGEERYAAVSDGMNAV
ncbi:hypothetical protein BKA65DRAFT_492747 [Rhexocercosporidium sp. MPI-PUGE-AT-0058]|nr:hypothetical protein BKA65DRAFT_492747 [Rhexocercosporidium sp. MPI-PUGE-AT-0058]